MTILEYLSKELDRQMTDDDIAFAKTNFAENAEYYNLCLQARALLLEQKENKCSQSKVTK